MFERLRKRLLANLPSNRGRSAIIEVVEDGVHQRTATGPVLQPWSQITRVDAYTADEFIGTRMVLALSFSDGTMAALNERDAAWHRLAEALAARLSVEPPAIWTTKLMAAPEKPLRLY